MKGMTGTHSGQEHGVMSMALATTRSAQAIQGRPTFGTFASRAGSPRPIKREIYEQLHADVELRRRAFSRGSRL